MPLVSWLWNMHKGKQSMLHHSLGFFNGYLCVCQKCVVLVRMEYMNSCKGKTIFWKLCCSFLLITLRYSYCLGAHSEDLILKNCKWQFFFGKALILFSSFEFKEGSWFFHKYLPQVLVFPYMVSQRFDVII